MCICGCVLEVAAVGATVAYVAKKRLNKGKDNCACSCHKKTGKKEADSKAVKKAVPEKQE